MNIQMWSEQQRRQARLERRKFRRVTHARAIALCYSQAVHGVSPYEVRRLDGDVPARTRKFNVMPPRIPHPNPTPTPCLNVLAAVFGSECQQELESVGDQALVQQRARAGEEVALGARSRRPLVGLVAPEAPQQLGVRQEAGAFAKGGAPGQPAQGFRASEVAFNLPPSPSLPRSLLPSLSFGG